MAYRFTRCPKCGLSEGTDDKILSSIISDISYNGAECTLVERRKCDVCDELYSVKMYYSLVYEELMI